MRVALLLLSAVSAWTQSERDVEITKWGTFQRTCRKPFPQEVEEFKTDRQPEAVWKFAFFIFENVKFEFDDKEKKHRVHDAKLEGQLLENIEKGIELFCKCVYAYSDGYVKVDPQIFKIEDTLTNLTGDANGGFYVYPNACDDFIRKHVTPGEIDSFVVYWNAKDMPIPFYGGTNGGIYDGAGFSCINVLGHENPNSLAEVTLHEWLHQFEWVAFERMGYRGIPDLHMALQCGYPPEIHRQGWMNWYHDFMLEYFTPRIRRDARMHGTIPNKRKPQTNEGHVNKWLVLGSYENENCSGYDKDFIDEQNVKPEKSANTAGKVWFTSNDARVSLFESFTDDADNKLAYGASYVYSEKETEAVFWVGSDDGVKVWLNGILIHNNHVHRGQAFDQDEVPVTLNAGWNLVLMKVDQGGGDWAFSLRITDKKGRPLPLKFSSDRQEWNRGKIKAREFKEIDWLEVADDPWQTLPLLDLEDLKKLCDNPNLNLTSGTGWYAISSKPVNPASAAENHALDEILNFRDEAFARIEGKSGTLFLARIDVMNLLSRCDRLGISKNVVGWFSSERRPAIVMLEKKSDADAAEVDLLAGISGDMKCSIRTDKPYSLNGNEAGCTLVLENRSSKQCSLKSVQIDDITLPFSDEVGPGCQLVKQFTLKGDKGRQVRRAAISTTSETIDESFAMIVHDAIEFEFALAPQSSGDTNLFFPVVGQSWGKNILRITAISYADKPVEAVFRTASSATIPKSQSTKLKLVPGERASIPFAIGFERNWQNASIEITAEFDKFNSKDTLKLYRYPFAVIGPFPNTDKKGFATAYEPEKGVDLDQVADVSGNKVCWFDISPVDAVSVQDNLYSVALERIFRQGWVCCYVSGELVSAADSKARIELGSDDAFELWVGGNRVGGEDVYRPAAPAQNKFDIDVKKGKTPILVKILQGEGGYHLFLKAFDTVKANRNLKIEVK